MCCTISMVGTEGHVLLDVPFCCIKESARPVFLHVLILVICINTCYNKICKGER